MKLALDHYRLLGRSGLRVSPLCLGTMTFGSDWGWGAHKETSRKMFETYAERGGNFIETANFYTNGTSESLLGEFMEGQRERFVLATKYSLHMQKGNPNSGGNHRKNMMESVEASLRRLRTDYIDLYWLHAWEYRTPIEEVMRAFDDLIRQGKILYIGISDTPAWKIAQANTLARARGWTRFIATQIHYHLVERTCEHEILPMAREFGIGVLPWSPLAGGVFSDRYVPDDDGGDETNKGAARKGLVQGMGKLTQHGLEIVETVKEVARELGVSPNQVALRWLLYQDDVVAPVIGTRKLSHLEDNLACLDVELSEGQLARLDAVSKPDPIIPNVFIQSERYKNAVDGDSIIEGGFKF